MRTLLLSMLVGGWLTACSAPPATPPTTGTGEPINETFWQLADDADLEVKVDPWPPVGGKASIEAHVGPGDWGGDKPTVETLEYRVVDKADSTAPYTRMTRSEKREDEATEYQFTARDVAFPSKTTVFVQFKPTGPSLKEPQMLTDWSLKVP